MGLSIIRWEGRISCIAFGATDRSALGEASLAWLVFFVTHYASTKAAALPSRAAGSQDELRCGAIHKPPHSILTLASAGTACRGPAGPPFFVNYFFWGGLGCFLWE